MGQPKVLLPWVEDKTIIEHIVQQLILAKVDEIVVVTGFYAEAVRAVVKPLGVRVVHNRAHKTGEMLSSLQTGLKALSENIAATLVVLGDQPRIQPKTVYRVLKAYAEGAGNLIIPSYQMQRGHPLLIGRRYWQEFLALAKDATPRMVINAHQAEITYITVDNDSILQDVDTPQEYRAARRDAGLEEYDLTKRS
jgi:molybdenum cofactor cytidylyltransferase